MTRILVILAGLGVLTAALFGIVYGAVENSGPSSNSLTAGHGGLAATANELPPHADAMRDHGQWMIEIGQSAGQPTLIDHGVTVLTNARRLDTASDQLLRTDRDLSTFRPTDSVDIYRLRADGRAIVEAGKALIAHADDMAQAGEVMAAEAETAGSPELREGSELMEASAESMRQSGQAVVRAGQPLVDEADQLERSLGH